MADLLMPAAEALYAAIGELATDNEKSPFHFEFESNDPSVLLRDFLNELLILFERDQLCLKAIIESTFTASRLIVAGSMAPVNLERSVFHREVKAITYHELNIREVAGGYEATFIVDI